MSRVSAIFGLTLFAVIGFGAGVVFSFLNTQVSELIFQYHMNTLATGSVGDGDDRDFSVEEPVIVEPAPPLGGGNFDVQRVFFGTDRSLGSGTNNTLSFGHGRSDELTIGYTDITIPTAAHRVGEVERPRSLTVFNITLWEGKEDPSQHFTVDDIWILQPDEFTDMAKEAAMGAKTFANSAFVFIHGFNTTFKAASFRTAQLAYDLGFDGPAFFYSWPSVGGTLDYVTDMDSAENAAPHMDEFLDMIFDIEGIDNVHIIAHSMGNAALAELLKRAGTRLSERNEKPVSQMILAAPDLDAGQFRGIAERFTRVAEGVTLYAASTDRALLASKSIRRNYERLGDVGDAGPVIVPGVDSIDVTAVGTEMFSLNHSIYASNRGVLDDLGQLLLTGIRPPHQRMPTLRQRETDLGVYWQIPD